MIVSMTISTLVMCLGMYSFIGLFSLLKVLVTANRYDELEKKSIIEAFSISMIVILIVYLAQLILSFFFPAEWKGIISPGTVNQSYITNMPLHIDSFLFDCSIIGISYMLRRYHYGLIKLKSILIPLFIILAIIFLPFLGYIILTS